MALFCGVPTRLIISDNPQSKTWMIMMARKKTLNNDSNGTTDQSSTGSNVTSTTIAPTPNANKRSPLTYVAVMAVVVIVIAIAYFALSGLGGGQSLTSKQIFSNVSGSGLNQTQSRFVNDLEKSENVSNLQVAYYSSNATSYIKESSNLTMAISNNQTIDSYKMGNYNKTAITYITAYMNAANGEVIAKNVSSIYYYNTNTTVTCFNDTTYTSGLVTNSSLQCGSGDQGLTGIEETPFTAVNVSSLSYLVFNSTVTYDGTKTIAGRGCDDFLISNATASNIQSNYSVFDLCIDTQYGVPLYFNQTDVVYGAPSSFVFTATVVSANVSSSELTIPQQYLSNAQQSII